MNVLATLRTFLKVGRTTPRNHSRHLKIGTTRSNQTDWFPQSDNRCIEFSSSLLSVYNLSFLPTIISYIFRSSIHSFKLLSILLFKLSNRSQPLQETRIEASQYYLIPMHCCWVMITSRTDRQFYIRNFTQIAMIRMHSEKLHIFIKIKDYLE